MAETLYTIQDKLIAPYEIDVDTGGNYFLVQSKPKQEGEGVKRIVVGEMSNLWNCLWLIIREQHKFEDVQQAELFAKFNTVWQAIGKYMSKTLYYTPQYQTHTDLYAVVHGKGKKKVKAVDEDETADEPEVDN